MDTLKNWKAKRAGAGMTITHATGKVTEVAEIEVKAGVIIATGADGRHYDLSGRAVKALIEAARPFAEANDTPQSQALKEALEDFQGHGV